MSTRSRASLIVNRVTTGPYIPVYGTWSSQSFGRSQLPSTVIAVGYASSSIATARPLRLRWETHMQRRKMETNGLVLIYRRLLCKICKLSRRRLPIYRARGCPGTRQCRRRGHKCASRVCSSWRLNVLLLVYYDRFNQHLALKMQLCK